MINMDVQGVSNTCKYNHYILQVVAGTYMLY